MTAPGGTWTFVYDNLRRMTTRGFPAINGQAMSVSFGYDPVGGSMGAPLRDQASRLRPFSPPNRLPPSFLRLPLALRLRAAGSPRSLFSPSNPTAHAAPGKRR